MKRTSFRSKIAAKGSMKLEIYSPDETGMYALKKTVTKNNLVVTSGLNWLRSYAFLESTHPTDMPAPMSAIAVGSNNTSPTNADTALGTEIMRKSFTSVTTGGIGVVTVATVFNAGEATATWAEAGIFNDDTAGGDMFDRVVFSATPKGADDVIRASFSFTFTSLS